MKTTLKLIGGLLIGIVVGLAIATVIVVVFTDTSFTEFKDNMLSTDGIEIAAAALVGVLSFIVSIAILIPIHEAGHLVCGVLTGYKFVSFRVFNLTFIKINGIVRVKKFSVAGTGGQCLLSPPDLPIKNIPTTWYNAGGVLANILMLLLILPLFLLKLNLFWAEGLVIFCLTDIFLILMNGIPMKINGISNDGYNIIYLNRNLLSKRAIVLQLQSNSLIQNGMRPKDMPPKWFEWRTDIDFKNPLEVSIPLMYASRLVDEMKFDEAYSKFNELYSHKADIMQLYVNEIACELAFCAMIAKNEGKVQELLDEKLRKYIEEYRKVMSSKQRILCAIALYLENDRTKATEIYQTLENSKERYLLQGEVKSDLAIMNWMLHGYKENNV